MPNKINIDGTVFEFEDQQARNNIKTINEKVFPSEKYTNYTGFKNGDYTASSSVLCTIVDGVCYVRGKIICSSAASNAWNSYNVLKNLPAPLVDRIVYGFVMVDASSPIFCQIDKDGNLIYRARDKSLSNSTSYFNISYPIA